MFSPDGKYISRLGVGKLEGPKGLCVDQRGNIVVVDNKASCVFVFQPNGKLLLKFGSRGGGDSQFSGLYFCAATPQNDYVVTDSHNHCVKIFDATGAFKFSFGSQGLGNGQFNTPTGVAVDNKGNILVADWGNSRIQVDACLTFFILH
jgi:tripartite motif-containing protein 2/3